MRDVIIMIFEFSVRLWSFVTWLTNRVFTSGKKQRRDIVRDHVFTISSIVQNSHKIVYLDFHRVNNMTLELRCIFVWYKHRTRSHRLSPEARIGVWRMIPGELRCVGRVLPYKLALAEARFGVSWVDKRHLWLWYYFRHSTFLVFDGFENSSEL